MEEIFLCRNFSYLHFAVQEGSYRLYIKDSVKDEKQVRSHRAMQEIEE